jgi:hypothetical protein
MSYGAIIALAPDEGNSTGACLEERVPMHSVFAGIAFSQLSSWDDSSLLFAEYHEPACVASRPVMSTDFAFNLLKNRASAYSNDCVKIAFKSKSRKQEVGFGGVDGGGEAEGGNIV